MEVFKDERIRKRLEGMRLDYVAARTGIAAERLRRYRRGDIKGLYSDEAAAVTRFLLGLDEVASD